MSRTDPVTVRRATPADAAAVHALVQELAAHEGSLAHVHVTPRRWEQLLERADVVVLLAERDGHAVGYTSAVRRLHLWSGDDVVAVDDVYVRPGHRDAGVGRLLLTTMARWVAAPEGLALTWGVELRNVRAQRFYTRLGATLRPKVVAGWSPTAYATVVGHGALPTGVSR